MSRVTPIALIPFDGKYQTLYKSWTFWLALTVFKIFMTQVDRRATLADRLGRSWPTSVEVDRWWWRHRRTWIWTAWASPNEVDRVIGDDFRRMRLTENELLTVLNLEWSSGLIVTSPTLTASVNTWVWRCRWRPNGGPITGLLLQTTNWHSTDYYLIKVY